MSRYIYFAYPENLLYPKANYKLAHFAVMKFYLIIRKLFSKYYDLHQIMYYHKTVMPDYHKTTYYILSSDCYYNIIIRKLYIIIIKLLCLVIRKLLLSSNYCHQTI